MADANVRFRRVTRAVLWDERGVGEPQRVRRPRSKVGKVLYLVLRLWVLYLACFYIAWTVVWLVRGDYMAAATTAVLALILGSAVAFDVWVRVRKDPRWPRRLRTRPPTRHLPSEAD